MFIVILRSSYCRELLTLIHYYLDMWKVLIGVALMFSVGFAKWFYKASEGLEYARRENKPVAFYFYSNYCPYCTQMEEFVLNQEYVQKKL